MLTNHLSKITDWGLVLPAFFQRGHFVVLDLTASSSQFQLEDYRDMAGCAQKTQALMAQHQAVMAVGRYNEERVIYQEELFTAEEAPRVVHLGMDLTVPQGTPVFAPADGRIHSFQDNARPQDYGPTIVIEHHLEGVSFHTLYGHLSRQSLQGLVVGQVIKRGACIGWIGNMSENGGWPAHLHFQVIEDMGSWRGDFPGVASLSEREAQLLNCPDPNLILQLTWSRKRINNNPVVG